MLFKKIIKTLEWNVPLSHRDTYNPLCKTRNGTHEELKQARIDHTRTTARMYRILFISSRDRRAYPVLFTNEIAANLPPRYFQSTPKLESRPIFRFTRQERRYLFARKQTSILLSSFFFLPPYREWNPSVPSSLFRNVRKVRRVSDMSGCFRPAFEGFRKQRFPAGIWPANTSEVRWWNIWVTERKRLQRVTCTWARAIT